MKKVNILSLGRGNEGATAPPFVRPSVRPSTFCSTPLLTPGAFLLCSRCLSTLTFWPIALSHNGRDVVLFPEHIAPVTRISLWTATLNRLSVTGPYLEPLRHIGNNHYSFFSKRTPLFWRTDIHLLVIVHIDALTFLL